MKKSNSTRLRWVAAAVTASSLLIAACGGDDGESTSDSVTSEAPTDTTGETGEGESGSVSEDALARVAAFLEPITELPLNEAVVAPTGKKLFYVQCSVPVCEEISVGVKAAAEAAGWTYETASHSDTPDTVAAAFDTAIAASPDVILTSGNPREWFAAQLATLRDNQVPIISWSLPEAYEPGDGISVNLLSDDDYYFYGVLMADYAAANTVNKKIQFVGLPVFPVLSTVQKGFQDEIAKACPDCSVEILEVALADIGKNLPGTIVSLLQSDPELDMIVYAFGGMLFGVPDALASAGLIDQAKAVSQAGGPLNFGFIVNGQHQVAEVGLASELLGWRAVDAAIRVLLGSGPGRAEVRPEAVIDGRPDILAGGLPLQILEADSIADASALWPGVEGFQDKFTALWGL